MEVNPFKNVELGRVAKNRLKMYRRMSSGHLPQGAAMVVGVSKTYNPTAAKTPVRRRHFEEDHFLGKLVKNVFKGQVKKATEQTAKKAGMTKAETEEFIKKVDKAAAKTGAYKKLQTAGNIAGGIAAAGLAVTAAPALGIGKATTAATAAKAGLTKAGLAKTIGKSSALLASGGAAISKLKGKTGTDLIKEATKVGDQIGLDVSGITEQIKNSNTIQSIKNIRDSIPSEVMDEIKQTAKKEGRKLKLGDIIENGSTSKELLPKNGALRNNEKMLARSPGISIPGSPDEQKYFMYFIVAVVVVIIIMAMRKIG